jgi:hypothetical protein
VSERKSAEIKFRCTPSFKSALAASAEAVNQTMSEYIEGAVAEKAAADGTRFVDIPQVAPVVMLAAPPPLNHTEYVSATFVGNAVPAPCSCRPWEFCTHKASA